MRRSLLALLLVLGLIAAACGDGDEASTDQADSGGSTAATSDANAESSSDDAGESSTEGAQDAADPAADDAGTDDGDADDAAPDDADEEGDVAAGADEDRTDDADADDAEGDGIRFGDLVLADPSEVTSARFDGVFTMIPDGTAEIDGPIEMTFGGAFNQETESSEMAMDFGALMAAAPADELAELPPEMEAIFTEPMQIVTIGDTAYINWGLFALFLGADGWIEMPASETGDVTGGFGFGVDSTSPYETLNQLDEAEADFQEIGRESVNGADTTHYRAIVDFEKAREQMSPEEVAELEEAFGANQPEIPIDIWIGDDGYVYRYQFAFTNDGTEDMEGFESVTATFEMFDFNSDVVIEAPDPSEVTSAEDLGGFFDLGG